jgi:hypothetical protein
MLPWVLGIAAIVAVIVVAIVLFRRKSSGRPTLRIDHR